ncbi:MAG: ABC transporter permease, partial [Chloroflexota bacterium]
MTLGFWMKWALRDLRQRWTQVLVIAIIIGLGTGLYAGLRSVIPWRLASYDASYEALNMYDLNLMLDNNVYLPEADLLDAVSTVDGVAAVQGRLTLATLVEVARPDDPDADPLLVAGQLIGLPVGADLPPINQLHLEQGRAFAPDDTGAMVAALEYKFARHYNITPSNIDAVRVSGGITLDLVATVQEPQYFIVAAENTGPLLGESTYAAVFAPLATVQSATEHSESINQVLVRLAPGADVAAVEAAVEATVNGRFGEVGLSLIRQADDPARRTLYEDVRNDDTMFLAVSLIFLFGAALGAFNLVSRMVEAMRREIGIGMALGTPTRLLVVRPLLAGAQIALLGVAAGVILGLLLSELMGHFINNILTVPVWQT